MSGENRELFKLTDNTIMVGLLSEGVKRFNELRRLVPGVTQREYGQIFWPHPRTPIVWSGEI